MSHTNAEAITGIYLIMPYVQIIPFLIKITELTNRRTTMEESCFEDQEIIIYHLFSEGVALSSLILIKIRRRKNTTDTNSFNPLQYSTVILCACIKEQVY